MSETTKQVNDGGPAFPHIIKSWANDNISQPHAGMNLRDYFAAKAMQAVINDAWRTNEQNNSATYDALARGIALDAYTIADAMLAQRKSRTTQDPV